MSNRKAGTPANTPDDFWRKSGRTDNPDDCWLWTGGVDEDGYGRMRIWPKRWRTHCLAWVLTYGPIPAGYVVMHTCDVRYPLGDATNRRCGNPAHLKLGTASENTRDRHLKGRDAWGNPRNAKIDADRAEKIRRDKVAGMRTVELSSTYGLCRASINNIVASKTWKPSGIKLANDGDPLMEATAS